MPSSGVQTCALDRKSTRLNSSHLVISYAVFCLTKKNDKTWPRGTTPLLSSPAPGGQLWYGRPHESSPPSTTTSLSPFFFFLGGRAPRTFSPFPSCAPAI